MYIIYPAFPIHVSTPGMEVKITKCYIRSYLEDFDLAAGRVQMFCVVSRFVLFERVNLNAKRHPFLTAMLSHCKLCTDAMNLKISK